MNRAFPTTNEIPKIRQKLNAGYPLRFNGARKQFNDKLSEKCNGEDDYILPPDYFEVKTVYLIESKQLNVFLGKFTDSLMIHMKAK